MLLVLAGVLVLALWVMRGVHGMKSPADDDIGRSSSAVIPDVPSVGDGGAPSFVRITGPGAVRDVSVVGNFADIPGDFVRVSETQVEGLHVADNVHAPQRKPIAD
jgi:hypothetical protein